MRDADVRVVDVRVVTEAAADGQDVTVHGRIDARTAADLRDALWGIIEAGEGELRLHLASAEIGDSTGLGLLAHTHTHARRHDRRLVLADASERTDRLLRASRLGRVILRGGPRLAEDEVLPRRAELPDPYAAARHAGERAGRARARRHGHTVSTLTG